MKLDSKQVRRLISEAIQGRDFGQPEPFTVHADGGDFKQVKLLTLVELREVIGSVLGENEELDQRKKVMLLQGIAERKRPYLVGQWKEVNSAQHRYASGKRPGGKCWTANDPVLGDVY